LAVGWLGFLLPFFDFWGLFSARFWAFPTRFLGLHFSFVFGSFSLLFWGLFSRFFTLLKQAENGTDWGGEKRGQKSDER